jgi:glycopeptide antibiotics resistance protein
VKVRGRNIRKRDIFAIALVFYFITLLIFTFFPRPILESGDPSAVAEYLRTHANFFYKILYADTQLVAVGNLFMLTPLVLIANRVFPTIKLQALLILGFLLSLFIELSQLVIPGRVSDPVDLISNTFSVVFGIFLVRLLQQKNQN